MLVEPHPTKRCGWQRETFRMRRAYVLETLQAHRDEIRALGVRSLAIFGSVARDEAIESSDVDVLVDFDKPGTFDAFMELKERLEAWLGANVDLVTRKALKPRMRASVEAEALLVA